MQRVRWTSLLALVAGLVAVLGGAPSGVPGARAADGVPDVVRVAQVAASDDPKTAVVASGADLVGQPFSVVDADGDAVAAGVLAAAPADGDGAPVSAAPWAHVALADWSAVTTPGGYRVQVGAVTSPTVTVEAAPYGQVLASLLSIYDANADGRESTFHGASHLHDARSRIANGPRKGSAVDVTGGWMDSGDQLKFTGTIGYAATMLQLAARAYPALATRMRTASDVGVRFLVKAHPRQDVFVAQVGDEQADHNRGFRSPTADDGSGNPLLRRRPSLVLTSATGGSDVAAIAATALALAAQRTPAGAKRTRLVTASRQWLAKAVALKRTWRNCCYQQDSWRDDVALAQVELGIATGKSADLAAADSSLRKALDDDGEPGIESWEVQADGYDMNAITAGELCGVLGRRPAVSAAVRSRACGYLAQGADDVAYKASFDPFAPAADPSWGMTRGDMSGALTALLAGRDDVALRGVGWFLGANQWGLRWQAGYDVVHPYHWAQVTRGGSEPIGAVVGGPAPRATIAANALDDAPYAPGPLDTARIAYRDNGLDYVTNEVGIPYSAPAVLVMALLAAR